MTGKSENRILLTRKSGLLLILVAGIVLLGASTLISRKTINKFPNNMDISPTPSIITGPATLDEKRRILTSPVIQDPQTREKYSFTVEIPQGWEVERNEFTSESHTLVIRKNEYTLTISGPLIDNSMCNFAINGDVASLRQSEAEQGEIGEIYDQYSLINGKLGNLRLGRIDAGLYKDYNFVNFNICQLDDRYSSYLWVEGTKIGYINLRTPYTYEEKIIEEAKKTISNIEYFSHK